MKLNFHENHILLFNVVFWGFVFLSIIIAIVPAYQMNDIVPTPGLKPMTPAEFKGLKIYVSEGCLYCHTQQVRPLESDLVFGRPSAPGDYAYLKPLDEIRMTPAVLGSERTGPDLSNIGNRQPSESWHYIHLYDPRTVVKSSIMQAYPWLFEIKDSVNGDDIVIPIPADIAPKKGKVVATEDVQNLVAYLLYLKQAPIEGVGLEDNFKTMAKSTSEDIGKNLYNSNCASCHQQNGEGVPGIFPPLKNSRVVDSKDAEEHIRIVLFGSKGKVINGVEYAAEMPAQAKNFSDDEIAAIINYERTSWGNNGTQISVEEVKMARTKKQ